MYDIGSLRCLEFLMIYKATGPLLHITKRRKVFLTTGPPLDGIVIVRRFVSIVRVKSLPKKICNTGFYVSVGKALVNSGDSSWNRG